MSLHLNRKKTSEQRQPRKRASASAHSAVSTATSSRSSASAVTSKKPRKRSTSSKKKSTPRRSLLRRTPLWVILSAVAAAVALYIFIFVHFFVDPFSFRWNAFYGEAVTPDGYDIRGIDISHYQDPIDWSQLRNADINGCPIRFVFIKATEGTDLIDENFNENFYQARQNDIIRGAYHFFSPLSDARKQARFFLKNTNVQANDLPPVLDVEPTDREISKGGGEQKLFESIRIWMNTVEASTGKRPILYVSQKFIRQHLVKAPDICEKYQVWIARYGEYRPEVKLLFWQLTPFGRVRGIHGDVDINVFNGYHEQFHAYKAELSGVDATQPTKAETAKSLAKI